MPRNTDLIKRLLIKVIGFYTKLTPFVLRGPCASQFDQKTNFPRVGKIWACTPQTAPTGPGIKTGRKMGEPNGSVPISQIHSGVLDAKTIKGRKQGRAKTPR